MVVVHFQIGRTRDDCGSTLSECFAISFCGFALMDNHLHVLLRLDSHAANGWSAEEVVRRWLVADPPKSADGQAIEVPQGWIDDQASDKEDDCKHAFGESRCQSIAILDDEALLATCASIGRVRCARVCWRGVAGQLTAAGTICMMAGNGCSHAGSVKLAEPRVMKFV